MKLFERTCIKACAIKPPAKIMTKLLAAVFPASTHL